MCGVPFGGNEPSRSGSGARARPAALIFSNEERRQANGSGQLEASQGQIGDALGLTAVHVNRTLKALRQTKVVSIHDRMIRIHEWALLAAIGDFNPRYLQLEPPEEEAA